MDLASQTVTLVTEALSLRRGSYLWYVFASGCSSVALLVLKKMATVGLRAIEDYRLKGRHDRVIIFSRYPVPGKSKTRLIPLLGQRGASTCQLRMTDNLLRTVRAKQKASARADDKWCVELRYNGGDARQMSHWMVPFKPSAEHRDTIWRPQADGDLGHKMAEAIGTAFKEGARRVVVVGSDIPGITADIVSEAFATVAPQSDSETVGLPSSPLVLGPALDGGYYLLAAHCDMQHKLDEIFSGIAWGTETVRQEQITAARRLDIEPTILTHHLSDLDVPGDFDMVGDSFGHTAADFHSPRVGVVIPVLNEERNIEECIRQTVMLAAHPDRLKIVVSDGGSTDTTCQKVLALAADLQAMRGATLELVHSPPGRGTQQNNGAASAGDVTYLVFVHADNRLPLNFDDSIVEFLSIPGNVLGCFRFWLDVLEPNGPAVSMYFRLKMRILSAVVRRRVENKEMPYGDQCLFLARQTFEQCGGFPNCRLMEDYILVKTVQQIGHVGSAPGPPTITSARRWMKYGIMASVLNFIITTAYELGVQPDTLADLYYGRNHPAAAQKVE